MNFEALRPRPFASVDSGGARPFGFHAPHWAQFVAAGHDGMVWAFQECPVPDERASSWRQGVTGGRFLLLGSCRQEVPNWEEAILHRRGGLWRTLREEEEAEREADLRRATSGTLWAIAWLTAVVLAIFMVQSMAT